MFQSARRVQLIAAVGAYAFTLALSAHATTVCRWVDEKGRTQVSGVVPAKYRESATCNDSSEYEPSPQQRRQAQEQAAKDKAAATASQARRDAASVPSVAAGPPSATPAKRPAQGVSDTTDCETWRRLYQESVDCFAPFRTTRGATKPEAFEACTPIPSPELKCGPVRQ